MIGHGKNLTKAILFPLNNLTIAATPAESLHNQNSAFALDWVCYHCTAVMKDNPRSVFWFKGYNYFSRVNYSNVYCMCKVSSASREPSVRDDCIK